MVVFNNSKWVTHEVLHKIRQYGVFTVDKLDKALWDADIEITRLRKSACKDEREV